VTAPPLTGLGSGDTPAGASSGPGAQETPAGRTLEPVWVIVRATVNLSSMGQTIYRDQQATVDAALPHIREQFAAGWIVPIPANQQPDLVTDSDGNPTIKETAMTVVNKSQRKEVTIGFTVEGDEAEVQAEGQTKKTVKNTGETDVFFPGDFTGTSTITVQGSKPGSAADTGTITVA
jgi:hypothetical protein